MLKRTSIAAMVIAAPLMLFPVNSHASDWVVAGFNMDYANGTGTASAARAQFNIKEETFNFTDATFDVRWGADQLVIERPLENFSYTVETDFLKDVTSGKVVGLNFEAIPGKLTFGVTSARLNKVKDSMVVDKTSLSCQSASREISPIDSCIDYGRLNSDGVISGDTNIKEASLSITRGKMNFAVDLKGIGKIKGEGSASHDAATKVVRIKIDKVKLSILDVTGQFWSQLKDVDSDMIRVERPYIYVSYEKKPE